MINGLILQKETVLKDEQNLVDGLYNKRYSMGKQVKYL
jgi:hypothetical protein